MNRTLIALAVGIVVLCTSGEARAVPVTIDIVSESGMLAWGPLDHYADLGSPDWGNAGTAVATWVHPSWPGIPGATWVSTAYMIEDPTVDSWRRFQTSFFIPDESLLPTSSLTLATSDNAEQFFFNGTLIGSDGEVTGSFVDNYEWRTLLNYSITPVLGINTLDFIVRNYAMPNGTPCANPTGLLFSADVTYDARAVPEPGTMMLLGSGLLGLALIGRRRRNRQA